MWAPALAHTSRRTQGKAVEPSEVMIAQRPDSAAPVVRARAEELPFADDSFDDAMAVLSDHHWHDRQRRFDEMSPVKAL